MRSVHDPDGRRLPIKLDSTSNGEYEPVPLTAAAREARAEARRAAEAAARRVALPRRRYLVSLLGAAATLQAFDRTFAAAGAQGGRYAVPREAPFELAAAETALAGDEFIFDVQLHHVNPRGAWRQRAGSNAFRNFPNSACGKADHVECFSSEQMLKDVFWDSDTAMGVLSHVPGGSDTNPLDFDAAGATRVAANALDGTERLLLHGRVMPTLPGEIDGMAAQIASFPVAGFKTYTQFGPGGGFFLDDERHGAAVHRARAVTESAQHLRAQGPAVRRAGLRILDLPRHRPGGQALSGHELPDLPLGLRSACEGRAVRRASQGRCRCADRVGRTRRQPAQRLRRARQHLALRDARARTGRAPARQTAEARRRRQHPVGHRLASGTAARKTRSRPSARSRSRPSSSSATAIPR